MTQNSVNQSEINKFEEMADEWWDPSGKFKPLHKLNPVRIEYVSKVICDGFDRDYSSKTPLKDIDLLDVGCGGGLVAEPLSFMGANVTALDPSKINIEIARAHQQKSASKVSYVNSTIEELAINKKYDVITCLEVIEHVDNIEAFLKKLTAHLKPGGVLFVATINRTLKSLLFAKFTAEYILNWLPHGTHDYKKFLKPSEINALLPNFKLKEQSGFKFDLLNNSWKLTKDLSQNYIMVFAS